MCQLCANVLTAIYHEKVKPAYEAEDFKFQFSWEVAQKSVVSSVFDFIDQNPSKSNKTVAGNALYPTICAMFYPPVTVLKWTSTSLVFNVNLLLTESVTNHPDNQSRLRSEQLLGPTRMGCTLSQSKDFLVVDALLALIGVLLPPRQTRGAIKKLIAASSTDWDPPPAIYTTGLRTSTPLPDVVNPLYIDNQGLFANIEQVTKLAQEGAFDSYQVSFRTIERIKIGGPEADMPKKNCTMQFQLKNADAGRFLETLKARGLSKLISDTKVSKIAEGLNLEFTSSGRKPATQQEKVAKVEQLWQSNDTGRGEPTSPLVAVSSKSRAASRAPLQQQIQTAPRTEAPPTTTPAAASSSSRHRVRIILDSDEEDAAAQQPRRGKGLLRKSAMKKLAVESDDEEVKESQSPPSTNAMDQDFEPTQPEAVERVANVPARVTRGAAKKNPALGTTTEDPVESKPAPAPCSLHTPSFCEEVWPIDDELSMSEDEIETTTDAKPSAKAKAQETSAADAKAKTRSDEKDRNREQTSWHKRTKADDDQDVPEDEDAPVPDRRPTKRLRGATVPALEEPAPPPRRESAAVFGTVNPAPAKKRYAPCSAIAAPPPVAEKVAKAAKQESGVNETHKGRAPPKSSKVAPPGKNKTKTQTAAATTVPEESEDEAKPARRSTRTTNAVKTAEPIVQADRPKPKPKTKPEKPQKAPWEDMHLRKKDDIDAIILDEPPAGSDMFEEYYVPLKARTLMAGSADSPIAQDDVTMLDLIQDASPKAKTVRLEETTHVIPIDLSSALLFDSTSALPLDSSSALQASSTSALRVNSASAAVPLNSASVIPVKSTSTLALDSTDVPTINSKSATVKVDRTTPIRPQTHSPVAASEPVPALPLTKFKPEVPSRPMKPVSFLQKVASPSPPPTPPKHVHSKKTSTPLPPSPPVHYRPSPRSPVPPARRKVATDSPFPERVYHTVAFAPSKAHLRLPSSETFNPEGRQTATVSYERTPNMGRPARTFGRAPHKYDADERDHDHKRSRSPMQGIIEILNEMQQVIVENVSQQFEHVKKDVRVGRDTILRGAAASLESMCTESEGHFNTLVDLEEDYAAYHRKIILSIDEMQKSAEVMSSALGQIVQHHDRRSLSKKLPTTLFTLPSILRNPVLAL
ncbi:hypothetical protein B0H13DRAFT_2329167 [Mycena leptocephala]|nr:hypothetical protein B0H13DRAFT_2329167 [Mycena leptocephala]